MNWALLVAWEAVENVSTLDRESCENFLQFLTKDENTLETVKILSYLPMNLALLRVQVPTSIDSSKKRSLS